MLSKTTFDTTITKTLEDNNFKNNDFFIDLADSMTKDQFIRTQHQFYYAVTNFSSALALVAAAIPTYEERMKIIRNLWEEHGDGNPEHTHGRTFVEFMKRLTSNRSLSILEATEEVDLFNTTLNGTCKQEHYLKSVAMMGMIERMFADISAFIGDTTIQRGWMKKEEMIHYSLHQELDCIHAEDFFSILRKHYDHDDNRKIIDEGLKLGALTFLTFYQNLRDKVRD